MNQKDEENYQLDLRLQELQSDTALYSYSDNKIELRIEYRGAEFEKFKKSNSGVIPKRVRVNLTLDTKL